VQRRELEGLLLNYAELRRYVERHGDGDDPRLLTYRSFVQAVDALLADFTVKPEARTIFGRWYGLPGYPRGAWRDLVRESGLSYATIRRYRDAGLARVRAGLST
jgi:hypothetical protein